MSDELRDRIEQEIRERDLAKQREYRAKWRQKNRERLRTYQRGWRMKRRIQEENKEQ